jgi:hypothetical protein
MKRRYSYESKPGRRKNNTLNGKIPAAVATYDASKKFDSNMEATYANKSRTVRFYK